LIWQDSVAYPTGSTPARIINTKSYIQNESRIAELENALSIALTIIEKETNNNDYSDFRGKVKKTLIAKGESDAE